MSCEANFEDTIFACMPVMMRGAEVCWCRAAAQPSNRTTNGNYGRPQPSRCLKPTQIEWSMSLKMKSRKSDTGKRNGPCLDAVKQIRDVDGGLMFWRRRDIENQAEDWMTRVGLELLLRPWPLSHIGAQRLASLWALCAAAGYVPDSPCRIQPWLLATHLRRVGHHLFRAAR